MSTPFNTIHTGSAASGSLNLTDEAAGNHDARASLAGVDWFSEQSLSQGRQIVAAHHTDEHSGLTVDQAAERISARLFSVS